MVFISQQLICADSDSVKELKHCVSHITLALFAPVLLATPLVSLLLLLSFWFFTFFFFSSVFLVFELSGGLGMDFSFFLAFFALFFSSESSFHLLCELVLSFPSLEDVDLLNGILTVSFELP